MTLDERRVARAFEIVDGRVADLKRKASALQERADSQGRLLRQHEETLRDLIDLAAVLVANLPPGTPKPRLPKKP